MTDADKKLYDKAEKLFCQNCKLRTEQCLFAYRKVNGIEDCHKSCGCNEVPAWIDGYQKGLKAKINATTISDCPHKDEWHYPAKGELPKASGNYILAFYGAEGSVASGKPCCEETFFDAELLRWKEINTYDDLPYLEKKGVVIAWRELPEPPKEEE